MSLPAACYWYVVATRPKGESDTVRSLERLRLQTYVPDYTDEVRKRGRRLLVTRRLFPGYVFVGTDGDVNWQAVSSAWGVHSVVGCAGTPARMRSSDVSMIQFGEITGAFNRRFATLAEMGFVPGAEVKALDGAFASFCGKIVEAAAEDRIRVLFALLGKSVPVTMGLDALELI
jgi:transcription antitermination factor NusG